MRRPSWSTIFVFAVIAVLLVAINARPGFPDPDSFYHAKIALMIRDHGFIQTFPWLQETVLRDQYVDAHLGYHVVLIPFVTLFDPLVGMKVSAVVFGLIAFYALYRFLRSIGSPYPEWITLAAAMSTEFLHRMSLPRAPSLSVALLILGVWAMLNARNKIVFFVAVAFVWYYHGWPVFLSACLCLMAAELFVRKIAPRASAFPLLTIVAMVGIGIVVGHAANPYFPANISFSVLDIFKIGIAGGPNIPVGSEWSRPDLVRIFVSNLPVVTAFLAAIALFFSARRSNALELTGHHIRAALTLTFLSLFFLVFTLKSIRYVEYLIPSIMMATGVILAMAKPFLDNQIIQVKADLGRQRWIGRFSTQTKVVAGAIGITIIAVVGMREVHYATVKKDVFSQENYQGSADWLKRNLKQGDIVFNTAWDSSMIYFYLDDGRYQLVGLDPRFMYDANKDRYKTWSDLSRGNDTDLTKIRSVFHSSAVLIDKRNPLPISQNLDASDSYVKAYEDEWAQIYILKTAI